MDRNSIFDLQLRLAMQAVALQPDLEIPTIGPDGSELKTADEVASAMGIPRVEALLRMSLEGKDVFSALATHAIGVGVGTQLSGPGPTLVARGHRQALRKKKRTKRVVRETPA